MRGAWYRLCLALGAVVVAIPGALGASKASAPQGMPLPPAALDALALKKMGYTLLHPEDLFLTPKRSTELRRQKSFSRRDVESIVADGYTFIGDFFVSERSAEPRLWARNWSLVDRLTLGEARTFVRSRPSWLPLLFVWNHFHLLKGDHRAIQITNAALQHWHNKNFNEALKSFGEVEKELEKLSPMDPVRLAVHSVRAGYYLFRYQQEGRAEDYEQVRQDLLRAYLTPDINLLTHTFVRSVHPDHFTLNNNQGILYQGKHGSPPRFFEANGKEKNRTDFEFVLSPVHLSPEEWWASQAFSALWNLSAMNRTTGLFEKGFFVTDKIFRAGAILKGRYASLPKTPSSFFVVSDSPSPELSRVFSFAPRNLDDLISSSHLMNLFSYLQDSDPQPILAQASRVILSAQTPWLKSLAFSFVGDTYFDLNVLDWAKRAYAWAEVYGDTSLLPEAPGPYLFAAEAQFWSGKGEESAAGFQKFIDSSGDRQMNPWARLRLAEVLHLKKNFSDARSRYEEIIRMHPQHIVAGVARVRAFCIDQLQTPLALLEPQVKELLPLLPQLDSALSEQAKACLLRGKIQSWRTQVSSESPTQAKQRAAEQRQEIADFKQSFPDSRYLSLFSGLQENFDLQDFPEAVSSKNCLSLNDIIEKNSEKLFDLNETAVTLPGLKWGSAEQDLAARCAALYRKPEQWEQVRGFVKKKMSKNLSIEEQLYLFIKKSQKKSAQDLRRKLIQKGIFQGAQGGVSERDLKEKKGLEDEDFWYKLTSIRIREWELAHLEQKTSQRALKPQVNRFEERLKTEKNCRAVLLEASQFRHADWDMLFWAAPAEQWQGRLKEKSESCHAKLALKLLDASLNVPSPVRDELFLLPYLKGLGYKNGSELWLLYVQRLQKNSGVKSRNVQDIYGALAKESEDPVVKKTAQLWVENHGKK